MKQSSKRLTSIIVALGMVVVALVAFFDAVQPAYSNFEQTKGTIAGENDLYQTENQAVATAKRIIDAYQAQAQGQQTVNLAMPTTQDIAGALAQVYGVAQNNGVNIEGMSISAPTLAAATAGGSAATTKPIGTYSLQLNAVGSYESLTNFIMGLETNIRIFDVKNFALAPAQSIVPTKGVAVTTQDLFTYNITVTTYYQTN